MLRLDHLGEGRTEVLTTSNRQDVNGSRVGGDGPGELEFWGWHLQNGKTTIPFAQQAIPSGVLGIVGAATLWETEPHWATNVPSDGQREGQSSVDEKVGTAYFGGVGESGQITRGALSCQQDHLANDLPI